MLSFKGDWFPGVRVSRSHSFQSGIGISRQRFSGLHWEVKLLGPCREAGSALLPAAVPWAEAKLFNILRLRFLICGMLVGRIK